MNDLNERIRAWWNEHPYTYGVSKTDSYRDVGDIPDNELNASHFDRYMQKSRKQFFDAQKPDEPLAARFIDYDTLPGKKVLDIACGFGWATVEMARYGANVTGIDLTPRAIAATAKHCEYRNLEVELQVMDAQKMTFPDEIFDFVHAWGCLMHMPDTEKAISEINRVLKPGGWTSGYMYNKRSISYWWHIWLLRGVLMGRLIRYGFDTTQLVSRYTDGITIGGNVLTKVYTPKQATTMFKAAGFADVKFNPWGPPNMLDNFPVSKLPLGRYLSYAAKKTIASRYGWGMVFYARKPL